MDPLKKNTTVRSSKSAFKQTHNANIKHNVIWHWYNL